MDNQIKAVVQTMARNGSSSLMACTTSVSMSESRKTQERESKGQTTLFSMQLLLHIHCSVGVFKAAHVPTDTGWWARILAASSWGLKRKRYPVSEWLHMYIEMAITPLRRCLGGGRAEPASRAFLWVGKDTVIWAATHCSSHEIFFLNAPNEKGKCDWIWSLSTT